ncbi:MAG: type II toxin-antitoxin system RelE/ParE family toxin [Clostridia bacterium]|nr:type II toxin-antitoxin system RelE/ParE family toxin [Clostridia bacterium]
MPQIKAEMYDLPDGTYPIQDFIESLDIKMKTKVLWTVKVFEQFGTELREPYSKYLRDDIFELRVKVGSDISRVLYFFFDGNKAILTHGFIKKKDKTPPGEIDRAIKYRREYFSRKGVAKDD